MPDVYATITTADAATQQRIATLLELRAADPEQHRMRDSYLADVEFPQDARVLEVVLLRLTGHFACVLLHIIAAGGSRRRSPSILHDSTLEKGLGCFGLAPLRKGGVNNVSVLVDRPVVGGPFPVETTIWLIDWPCATNWTSMSPRSLSDERGCLTGQPLDPAIDAAAVDAAAPLGEPLDNIGIAQAVAKVPAQS
ncbi:MAG: hypothetical protein NVS2B7_38100 [Herpetosiphon sp.]